ncbi:ABC transporter permease [Dinghuibacter silviterrae]|uniref:ABC-type antimicrobial peptide transport system permease subunit n=1 Tax=Dinghuibacter silviterrae TaxID=1539049 RepID=A0A4R8DRM4_9BACT|nr:ABC transporter permease [Dinghuibacter silviterrae]TDX00862.1 ABC-type antimicrobial peptide transport system permease subunit [Dinghuibacter silviterrae]
MKDKDYIWRLIARKLSGEATEEELRELSALLEEDGGRQFSLQLLEALWGLDENGEGADEAVDRLQLRLDALDEDPLGAEPATPRGGRPAGAVSAWSAGRRPPARWLPAKSVLRTQFKTTYRNLLRSKVFSLINILGLALGMAAATLLLIVIRNNLTYDRFHKNEDRIYQVMDKAMIDGRLECWGSTPMPLAPVLRSQYPEVERVARTEWVGSFLFNVGDDHLRAWGYLTDNDFLSIFSLPLQEGDPATALARPHSIVLTQALSKKIFGDADPLGKTVSLDSNQLFTVTGLLKPVPANSRFSFSYLVPWSYMKEIGWENHDWINNSVITYVLLKPGVTEQTADRLFSSITAINDPSVANQLFLHPIKKWRLYSNFVDGVATGGMINFVKTLGVLAAFILLIACVNYMNLSTARSMRRAREVGIRKVMGAGKGALVWQFLGESILVAAMGGLIALGVAHLCMDRFDKLIDETFTIPYTDPWFWVFAVGFVLFTGMIAGSYPAFYLSSYQPIQVLKGTFKSAFGLVTPRKVLVVFQFTIAIALVICTIVIYRQVWFARHRDAGYAQENLLFIYINGDIRKNLAAIETGMQTSGAITGFTKTNAPVTDAWNDISDFHWTGQPAGTRQDFTYYLEDRNFASTIGLRVLQGRDIDVLRYPSDTNALVLTEAALHTMGFKKPLGQVVTMGSCRFHVVGVVKDFIHGSPYYPVWPTVIAGTTQFFGALTFRLNPLRNTEENLARIEEVFKKYNPGYPFEYKFVDEEYGHKFREEQHLGTLAAIFSGLAICISFLGLFALAAYMAESRIREIGIRRVLGATIANIATLLSKDFMKLIVIAFVIASPLAWWAMHAWLSEYTYRVSVSWWLFALTGIASFTIALCTVAYQAVRSARVSPAESLKVE